MSSETIAGLTETTVATVRVLSTANEHGMEGSDVRNASIPHQNFGSIQPGQRRAGRVRPYFCRGTRWRARNRQRPEGYGLERDDKSGKMSAWQSPVA